jgi:hypothetical protein
MMDNSVFFRLICGHVDGGNRHGGEHTGYSKSNHILNMAKRNKAKFASKGRKSALRVEALEQRQLLAQIVAGSGVEVGSNIPNSDGNTYDQILLTGSSVTVTADAGQVTRVSFLDQSGDIVQAEFAGAGTMTVALDTSAPGYGLHVQPANYNQTLDLSAQFGAQAVGYSQGLATITVQGETALTNVSAHAVGSGNGNGALFLNGKTGGDHFADIARVLIVADPANPGGFSTMGGIRMGDVRFSDSSGVVGISAANVNVQGPVIVGDIDAKNAGVPTLNFGGSSQFATLTVAGGDLVQTNGSTFVNNINGFTTINSQNGTDAANNTIGSQTITAATVNNLTVVTLDTTSSIDLTGKTQADINTIFNGRTFTNAVTVAGDLAVTNSISAAEFRSGVTFTGSVAGTITTTKGISSLTVQKDLTGNVTVNSGSLGALSVTGNLSSTVLAKQIGNVSVGGDLSGAVSTDFDGSNAFTTGEGSIGNVSITGNISGSGAIEGVLGIGNITVGKDITSSGANAGGTAGTDDGVFVTHSGTSGDSFLGNIGTLTVTGDVDQGNAAVNLINITNNGTYGNVTISGGGTQGKTDGSNNVSVGAIKVQGSLGVATAVTGNVSVTEDKNDVEFKGITIAGSAGSVGTLTINGPTAKDTDLTFGAVSATNLAVGAITVSGFEDITTAAITGKTLGAISITTRTGDATDDSTITIGGAITGSDSLGNITLSAAASGTGSLVANKVDFNASISSSKKIGDVTITSPTITLDVADAIKAGDTAGTITLNGATTISAAAINLAKATTAIAINGTSNLTAANSIKVGGALGSLTTTDATTLGAAATISLTGVTNAISLTGLTVGAGAQIKDAGSAGSLVLNPLTSGANAGLAADLSAAAGVSFVFDDGKASRDTVGSISINGRIVGAAGNDITASSVGDVTITGKLTQDQILVQNLDILAAPITNAATDKSEKVAADGSDLANYAIGNISVSSQLDLAYTGTRLFAGDNSFVALGKIGNVTLTGASSGAQQTALFNANTDAAIFAVGDVDGLNNQTALLPAKSILDTSGGDAVTATVLTGGTFSIGNIQVNARQSDATSNKSGVDNINGSAGSGLEGLTVLAGVRANTAAGAAGNVLSLDTLGNGGSIVNMTAVDTDVKGTIGSVLITSNNAVGFRDILSNGTAASNHQVGGVIAGLAGTTGDLAAGIVAATSTGAVQGGAAIAATDAAKVVIIGDADASADDTVEPLAGDGANQIVVVVL